MKEPKTKPPRLAEKILLLFLREDLAEDVIGDLDEKFYEVLRQTSPLRAKANYWYQVFHYLRPFAVRKATLQTLTTYGMIQSYFKTAYRSQLKNKLLATINVVGLSIGMAVSLTIGLWMWDELSYDKVHERHDRIAQVIQNVTNNGEVQTWTEVPWPLAEELRKNYGGDFDQVVLATGSWEHLLTTEKKKLSKRGLYAESDFPELLSLHMLVGSKTALTDPSTILISSSAAKAYFDSKDPINQILTLDLTKTVKVGGVYEDIPPASTFAGLDFIAPWEIMHNESWIKNQSDPWRPNAFNVFVVLNEKADVKSASLKIKDAKLRRVNEQLAKKKPALFLHPMNNWHLYSEFHNGINTGGRIQYVWLFGMIGAFVLIMACINFMNLTTARSEQRAKEVGIRKSIGSFRSQLISQFFAESILIAVVSFFISVLLVWFILPAFNVLADKQMTLPLTEPLFWLAGATFGLVTGLISGSYPALYLSGIPIGSALKGSYKAGPSATLPRKVLVVLQFSISVVLIVGTVTVFQQIEYAKSRPIGYDRSSLVTVRLVKNNIHPHFAAFRQELEKTGDVISVAEASSAPTEGSGSTSMIDWRGKDPNLSVDFGTFSASADYGKTIGWEIKAGRDFSKDIVSDSSAIILNESAVTYMGLKEPVGEIVQWYGERHVVGVIRDLVFQSPYEPVHPGIYAYSGTEESSIVIRINPERSASAAMSHIENVFQQFNPDEPFVYQFTDTEYGKKFGNEDRIGKLAAVFTLLAIFISCLGIFGLASFVAEQRTKEIGIRKVMGASVLNLWRLLSKDFIVLVLLSCSVAAPAAFFSMNSWLTKFEYRTPFPWWVLVASSIATLIITLVTVSFHTVRAAQMKPVQSLRSE